MSQEYDRLSDQEFMSEIYARHKGIMHKTAAECLAPGGDPVGVVHDAVLRLMEHVGTLRRLDDAALAAYVALTVRSVAKNRNRRRGLELRRFADPGPAELEAARSAPSVEEQYLEHAEREERLRRMRAALARLSPDDRALIFDKYISGVSDEALAERLGVKPESVRVRLLRARRKVRKLMEEAENDV